MNGHHGEHLHRQHRWGSGGELNFQDGTEAASCKSKVEMNEARVPADSFYAADGTVADIAWSEFKKNEPDDIADDSSVTLTFFKKCEEVPGEPY